MNYTKEIDSIIDWLTEEDGGHAVGESNIKEAVNDLKTLKQALNIDNVSESKRFDTHTCINDIEEVIQNNLSGWMFIRGAIRYGIKKAIDKMLYSR